MLQTQSDIYLTNIPQDNEQWGLCKVLMVRKESIHEKHIRKEVFCNKSIDIHNILSYLQKDLFWYMEYLTHKLRQIYHMPRTYKNDINKIIEDNLTRFFPAIELRKGMNNVIALDFDGVVTENSFKDLYNKCLELVPVYIVTANPTVTNEWFIKRGYTIPHKIFACKGKKAKINTLLSINQRVENLFYVDNETMYLDIAWVFNIKTYHYTNHKIVKYSLKTK